MAAIDITVSGTVVDELGVEASTTAYIEGDDAQTLAQVVTAYQAFITALDGVTSGQVIRGHVLLGPDLPGGIKGSPASGSRVEQSGVINFVHTGANKRWGFLVPALKNAAIVGGKINLSDTQVSALTTLLLGAVLGGNYSNNTFQVLSALSDAFIAFRKRRRQQRAKSYEI